MEVRIEVMRTGANRSYTAAGLAEEGAQALARQPVSAGIFGGFAAAGDFEGNMFGAHTQQVERLRNHERRLGVLGDRGHATATTFVEMEQRNADALRAVAWQITRA